MQGAVVKGPREARVANYFNGKYADWYRLRDWPEYLQEMMLKKHKNNRERFRLYQFLVANGLHPDIARAWVQVEDVKQGYLLQYGAYDESAERQFDQMKRQAADGSLFKTKYYDMHKKRVVNEGE